MPPIDPIKTQYPAGPNAGAISPRGDAGPNAGSIRARADSGPNAGSIIASKGCDLDPVSPAPAQMRPIRTIQTKPSPSAGGFPY